MIFFHLLHNRRFLNLPKLVISDKWNNLYIFVKITVNIKIWQWKLTILHSSSTKWNVISLSFVCVIFLNKIDVGSLKLSKLGETLTLEENRKISCIQFTTDSSSELYFKRTSSMFVFLCIFHLNLRQRDSFSFWILTLKWNWGLRNNSSCGVEIVFILFHQRFLKFNAFFKCVIKVFNSCFSGVIL